MITLSFPRFIFLGQWLKWIIDILSTAFKFNAKAVNKTPLRCMNSCRKWWINWNFDRFRHIRACCYEGDIVLAPTVWSLQTINSLDLHLPQPKCPPSPFFPHFLSSSLHLSICLLPYNLLLLSLFTKLCPQLLLTLKAKVKCLSCGYS